VFRGKDGLSPSSKKRSRTTQRSGTSIEPTDEVEGEKQQVAWEKRDTVQTTKKGRKIQVSTTNVPRAKAEAAVGGLGTPRHFYSFAIW
jgi:phage repressor protein C with HTH and peptisase S24 domain